MKTDHCNNFVIIDVKVNNDEKTDRNRQFTSYIFSKINDLQIYYTHYDSKKWQNL